MFIVMRQLLFLLVTLAVASTPLRAQDNDVLRHLSLSAGIGTTGITADLGTMVTDRVGLRGGIDYMPQIKYTTDLHLALVNQTTEIDPSRIPDYSVEVEGTLHNTTGHDLLDVYPVKGGGFRLTVGAYFAGKDKVVTVLSKDSEVMRQVADFNARRGDFSDVPAGYGQVAAKLGDYNIMPDDEGNASAYIQVKKVRPYVGLGFGRVVPDKSRLNFQFDLGVQLSGKPHVYNGVSGEELTSEGARGEDGGYLKTISKIHFYPVISVRIAGRLF